MPRHQASHTLDADLLRELDRLADEQEISRSELVNRLLQDSLARRQRAQFVRATTQAGIGTAAMVLIVHLGHILTLVT